MASDEPCEASDDLALLEGVCSLQFEGQHFTATGSSSDALPYWLELSSEAMVDLAQALEVAVCELPFVGAFKATFAGSSGPAPLGAGHLSMCSGHAFMKRLISARLIARSSASE